jgi:hypothetical protein
MLYYALLQCTATLDVFLLNGSEHTVAHYQGLTLYKIIFVCQSLVIWVVGRIIRVFVVAAVFNVAADFFKFLCVWAFDII